jgi:hypothetical protein
VDISQTDVETYILENGLDRTEWNDQEAIAAHFSSLYEGSYLSYDWDEELRLHKLYDHLGVNFVRDDKRLNDIAYQDVLAQKVGKPFPWYLNHILWYLETPQDAIQISSDLRGFFVDRDDPLTHFADWLARTAAYTKRYELRC